MYKIGVLKKFASLALAFVLLVSGEVVTNRERAYAFSTTNAVSIYDMGLASNVDRGYVHKSN